MSTELGKLVPIKIANASHPAVFGSDVATGELSTFAKIGLGEKLALTLAEEKDNIRAVGLKLNDGPYRFKLFDQEFESHNLGDEIELFTLKDDISAKVIEVTVLNTGVDTAAKIDTAQVFINERGGGPGKLDTDGVLILNEFEDDDSKFSFNIGSGEDIKDINKLHNDKDHFMHDCKNNKATKKTDGELTYWSMVSRKGRFASTGKTNWTARPEIFHLKVTNTISGINKARERGFLSKDDVKGKLNPRDQEFTVIGRVRGIKDDGETWSLKMRGDGHEDDPEDQTLCCSCNYPYKRKRKDLFGVEIDHPTTDHRNVKFEVENYPLMGEDWIGIKAITYNIKINNKDAIHAEVWIDDDPILRESSHDGGSGTGKFRNNWRKIWVYEEQRRDTVIWGGPSNQMRVDMCEGLDIAALNVRSIKAPTLERSPDIPMLAAEEDRTSSFTDDENDSPKVDDDEND